MQDVHRTMLYNLLAVIHRDGGQHIAQHGIKQAYEDALSLVPKYIVAYDENEEALVARDAAGVLGVSAAETIRMLSGELNGPKEST